MPNVQNAVDNIVGELKDFSLKDTIDILARSDITDNIAELVLQQKDLTNAQFDSSLAAYKEAKAFMHSTSIKKISTTVTNFFKGAVIQTKDAVTGLWTTIKANPLLVLASVIGVAITAFQKWKQEQEELRQAAVEHANELEQTANAVDSYIDKYEALHT